MAYEAYEKESRSRYSDRAKCRQKTHLAVCNDFIYELHLTEVQLNIFHISRIICVQFGHPPTIGRDAVDEIGLQGEPHTGQYDGPRGERPQDGHGDCEGDEDDEIDGAGDDPDDDGDDETLGAAVDEHGVDEDPEEAVDDQADDHVVLDHLGGDR